jgi:hypothetical protein
MSSTVNAQPFATLLFSIFQAIIMKEFAALFTSMHVLMFIFAANKTKMFAFRFSDTHIAIP